MHCGGIVLCGGRSGRMGWPKPALPFGPEPMLRRVVRLLGEAVEPVVVAASPGQELPALPADVLVVRDRCEGRGPLEGLYVGLAALPGTVEAAYATGCDAPLLVPGFVRRLIELAAGYQIAVPVSGAFYHPLAAVYRRSVLGPIETLIRGGRLRPAFLFDMVPTRRVAVAELVQVDPDLGSLKNVNDPSDYVEALGQAGLSAPPELLGQLGPKWGPDQGGQSAG
ncbi:MAG: molybdenum cofactor guanylyltransferase [Thermoguttaceae bacterium]